MSLVPYFCKTYHLHPHIGILPGWKWLKCHEHDLDNYQLEVEINSPGFKAKFTLRDHSQLKEISKEILQ